MLHDEEFGRLAFHLADEVHLVPINYAVDQFRRIVFRTAEGSKLLGLTMNADVAFEIDEFSEDEATQRRRARPGPPAGGRTRRTRSTSCRCGPGSTARSSTSIAIEVDEITGRHFELTRPWLHMRPQPDDLSRACRSGPSRTPTGRRSTPSSARSSPPVRPTPTPRA